MLGRFAILSCLFVACGLVACAHATGTATPSVERAPADALEYRFDVAEGDSLAYREVTTVEGREAESRWVFLERDAAGDLIIRSGTVDDPEIETNDDAASRHSQVRITFPLPAGPIGGGGRADSWSVALLGSTSSVDSAEMAFEDAFQVVGESDGVISLDIVRSFDVGFRAGRIGYQARYDSRAGRYVEINVFSVPALLMQPPRLGVRMQPPVPSGTVRLTYDEDASERRRAELALLSDAADEAGTGYAAYVAEHTATEEISRNLIAMRDNDESVSRDALSYHLVANPTLVWRLVLEQPSAEARQWSLGQLVGLSRPLPGEHPFTEEAMAVLDAHIGRSWEIDEYIADLAYPVARPLLERLAASGSALARESLAALQRPTALDIVLAASRPTSSNVLGLEAFTELRLEPGETEGLVVAVGRAIDVLPTCRNDGETQHALCVRALERLTLKTHGGDIEAWNAFWQSHRERPYEEWMLEAMRDEQAVNQRRALEWFGRREDSPAAHAVAVELLGSEHAATRMSAATLLARWGDPRGLPLLVHALDGSLSERRNAFFALGNLANATLGFEPEGTEPVRARAVARWRRWLQERQD